MNEENENTDQGYFNQMTASTLEHVTQSDTPPELLVLINKLQNNYSFFKEMGDKEVIYFLKLCEQKIFNTGDEIFTEGDAVSNFYLVVSGEVSISLDQKEIARLKQGSVFGEMAMLDGSLHTASSTAAESSLLFSITPEILSSQMPNFATKVTMSIARQLSDKLREANSTIKNLQRQLEKEAAVNKSPEESA